jgi:hypothetical protein
LEPEAIMFSSPEYRVCGFRKPQSGPVETDGQAFMMNLLGNKYGIIFRQNAKKLQLKY